MAYKAPGVTVRNQFEPLANPSAFGNRLLAIVGKVDTSAITNFPTFVQEMQMTTYSSVSFIRPYPTLGTVSAVNRVVSVKQGANSYLGVTSGTETTNILGYVEITKGNTPTEPGAIDTVVSTTAYNAEYVDLYVIDSEGNEYTQGTDYTVALTNVGGMTQVSVTWLGASYPTLGTKYYVVFGDALAGGPYDYFYFETLDEEDVTLTFIWKKATTHPVERSIYYVTIRKEFPYEADIYTNPDTALQDFGSMLNSTNTAVASELAFASYLAFGEGAASVMLVPYDASTKTFQDALDELLTRDEPTIIVAVDNSDPATNPSNARLLAAHVQDASSDTHKKFRIALLSPHYTTDYINKYTAATTAMHSRRVNIVAPSQLTFSVVGTDGLTRDLDETKYASIVLGAMMTRPEYDVATSMTRKASRLITKLTPQWDDAYMNLIATTGVTLFTKLRGNVIVRDDITTEPETILTAEPYITTIADDIAKAAIILLDASLIGQKLLVPAMLSAVNTRITSMLMNKQAAGIITAFGRPIIEIDANDPRKINVTVPVQPIFAAKYIDITFSYVAQL